MRHLFAALILVAVTGCAPADIARSSCESVVLATGDPWSCTVKADVVGRASSIAFDTASHNQIAHVNIVLRVTKGSLKVGYQDLTGARQLVVTPSEPADVTMQTRMHRERRSFTLTFEPVGGAVEGLTGTVKYSTP